MAKRSKSSSGTGGKTRTGRAASSTKKRGSAQLSAFRGVFEFRDKLAGGAGATTVSFLVLETASKSVAVNAAVTSQLYAEQKWPPTDLTAVMGTDYNYGTLTMRNFLAGVASALATGLPPYKFTWDSTFVNESLPLAVSALMAKIELATR